MLVQNKTLVAALPMYDLPDIQAANDVLWESIREHLLRRGISGVPLRLSRDLRPPQIWNAPDLLLAQTCGFPLVKHLRDKVQVVATPKYNSPGCHGAYHRSFIVVRSADSARTLAELHGRRCAINEANSNTGMNLMRHSVAPLAQGQPFFSEIITTGAHVASMQAVVSGDADVTAIDCVTFAHAQAHLPELRSLRILQQTAESPALPFITAASTPPLVIAALREALFAVALDPRLATVRKDLLLDGFEIIPDSTYEVVEDLEREALQYDYPVLS